MSRRQSLQAMAAFALSSVCSRAGDAPARQPLNIVWIVADDLGYGDLGCYGCRDIPTPNLDRFAGEGMRSTRFYAMPVCSPTRASLLTGLSPHVAGVESALMGEGGLPGDAVTVAKWLRARGYRTGLVGKWHLGYEGASLPNAQGFDEFFGHRGGKIHYFEHTDELSGRELHDLWENDREAERPGEYSTTMFTERACDFVRENKTRPFFLMLSYNAPHYARGMKAGERKSADHYIQAPPEYVERVARDPKNPTIRDMYAAAVACMDDGIGRFLKTLDEQGLRDRTLVVFMGDNGADVGHGGSSGPLSGHKGELSEGGIRAALLARLPGTIPARSESADPGDVRDLFATSAALAGAGAGLPPMEGRDASEIWKGTAAAIHDLCFAWREDRAVFRGRWKWIRTGGKSFLYDAENDPAETNNLAEQNPDLADDLASAWQQWARRTGASVTP